ncbi:MFS polyamine transporter [Pseudohyphozyma bogoriensis]|nr:MFS polyamine transporter [Pseudohyphozyma bogoriensis]
MAGSRQTEAGIVGKPSASELEKPTPPPTSASTSGKDGKADGVMTEEEWTASELHPRNWPNRKRWKNALCIAVTGFLSASALTLTSPRAGVEFGETNTQVITLATALYVMGLGLGPFLFAPISELKGRQRAYLISMTVGLIIMRCLAGVFGSSGPDYAYVYAIIYVYLVSLPLLFSKHDPPTGLFSYNWPAGTAGLCYIGLGIGFLSSAATAATMQDRIYRYCSKKYNDDGRPEYRLILTQIGMFIFPLGLLIWGWTANARTHWIAPIIGSAVFSYGLMMTFNSIQNWIVDAFFPYSAAAMAAASFLRSLTGCVLPIFSDNLFINLGYGWGGTLLALVSLPAVPAPLILFLYGKQLRERFKFEP